MAPLYFYSQFPITDKNCKFPIEFVHRSMAFACTKHFQDRMRKDEFFKTLKVLWDVILNDDKRYGQLDHEDSNLWSVINTRVEKSVPTQIVPDKKQVVHIMAKTLNDFLIVFTFKRDDNANDMRYNNHWNCFECSGVNVTILPSV